MDYMLDIEDEQIKILAKEVLDQLGSFNEEEEKPYYTLISKCIESVRLREIEPYKNELMNEINEWMQILSKLIKSMEGITKENMIKYKTKIDLIVNKIMIIQSEIVVYLDAKDAKDTEAYCKQVTFPETPGEQAEYPEWRIILLKDNIKTLSDDEIKFLLGHELAHAYIEFASKYGNQAGMFSGYEIDDRYLCDSIAEYVFKLKNPNTEPT